MTEPLLSADERTRYSRHILLPEVGLAGQSALRQASVLCVGAGAWGLSDIATFQSRWRWSHSAD